MDQKNALILFVKNPEKGKVKTRIAKTAGEELALKVYQSLLTYTRNLAAEVAADKLLYYSSFVDKGDAWNPEVFSKRLQTGTDLGQRMAIAFEQAFKIGYQKVVIIGSDCATLTPAIVMNAYEKLEKHPFVLGPAKDGGYYLLGMNRLETSVFEGIQWSTPDVLTQTIEKIKALEMSYALLETLSDIDYWEDWEKYGWELPE